MPDSAEDIYLLDAESIARVLTAVPGGALCQKIKGLSEKGQICACRRCMNEAIDGYDTPICKEICDWGIKLIDGGIKVDDETARLSDNLQPSPFRRVTVYDAKLTVLAKARLNGCILVTDDTGSSASAMKSICETLEESCQTFDDLFGNLQ